METLSSSLLVSAPAMRMSEIATQALIDGHVGKWIAFRLSDGGSDGVIYDSRADAVRHQFHESLCAYLIVTPYGMPPSMADGCLRFYRMAYDNGHRIIDPEQPDFILPTTNEDMASQLSRLAQHRK